MENQSIPANYRQLERLDTDTLKELVRMDCFVNDLDEGAILYALHLIASREQAQNGDAGKIDDMWDRFQTEYCTLEGAGQSLYDNTASIDEVEERSVPKRRRSKIISRRIAIVAAAISVLFATMVVAQASGLDIWGAIARWTDETFRFTFQRGGDTSSWLDSCEELDDVGCNIDYFPRWVPEGYIVSDVQKLEFTDWRQLNFTFENSESATYNMLVSVYNDPQTMQLTTFEKDDTPVQTAELPNGNEVYFFENYGYTTAAYQQENILYSITGDISQENVLHILASVEER